MSPTLYQAMAVGMPLAAVLLSLFIIFPTWGRFKDVSAQVDKNRRELQALKAAPLPPKDPVQTAAADVEEEPADFLRQITELAQQSGCVVEDLTMVAPGEGKPVAGVRPIRAKVTVSGHFARIRSLLWRLYRAPRLFAVGDLSLEGKGQSAPGDLGARPLTATFTLERYVAPKESTIAGARSGAPDSVTEGSSQ